MLFKSSVTIPAVVAISFYLIGGTSPAAADILHVPDDFKTIQEAIDAAVDGDEVVVADGTYTGAGNKNLDFQAKAITLRSETGNRDQCIIDCENDGRLATFVAGDTAGVESITIRNGNAAGSNGGAALLTAGSSPSFIDCVFQNCHSDFMGGALWLFNSSVTINGCAFQVNTAGLRGGAIYGSGASVAFVDTEFDGNQTERGGGVYISGGEATVSGCSFTGNSATLGGGGLRVAGNATLTCTDSSFTANLAGVGGDAGGAGILVNLVDPASQISGCQFTNNEATGGGGGLGITQNFPEISNCIFQGNVAGFGGGVLFRNFNTTRVENVRFLDNMAFFGGGAEVESNASPEFVNCLFAGNSAIAGGGFPASGGAIDIFGGTPTGVNCTFSGNSSAEFGGAVTVYNDGDLGLVNCVLWDNQAPVGAEIRIGFPDFGSGTVTVSYSDVAGGEAGVSNDGGTLNWGAGNIDRDPMFVDPGSGDYRLSSGSQAIDAGHNWGVPVDANDYDEDGVLCELFPVDLDDNPRFNADEADFDPGCGVPVVVDMGAYEYQFDPADQVTFADLNGDDVVGAADLLGLLASWGPCGKGCCLADLDIDGFVGASDLLALLANWGPCR